MRVEKRFLRWLIPVALIGVTLGHVVEARELRYAIGYPPGSVGDEAAQMYAEALEKYSDGELSVKVYPLSLLNFMEASAGVRDGMADSTLVLLPYFPAQYPSSNLAAEISMLLELTDASAYKAGMAYGGAMSEYIFHHCPECVAEFARQNQVFTGGSASSPYMLLCTQPITTMADVQGKRMRVGGAQWSRWASAMGATPISMSVNEIYEGLSQGVVDCTVQSAPELSIFGLMEVTDDITTGVPGGVFGGTGANNVNADTWQSLSDEERQSLLRASTVMSAQITWLYAQEAKQNLEKARQKDEVQVHEPGPELVQATHEFIEQDMQAIADAYGEKHGIENAEEMIATFRPILEKWVGLVEDVDSGEELADLYWNETFSEVDVSEYGL